MYVECSTSKGLSNDMSYKVVRCVKQFLITKMRTPSNLHSLDCYQSLDSLFGDVKFDQNQRKIATNATLYVPRKFFT